MNFTDIAISKNYTNLVALGLSNVAIDNKTGTVTFTLNDGSVASWTFPIPKNGVSVTNLSVDSNNHLIVEFSDGTTHDAGVLPMVSDPSKIPYTNSQMTGVKNVKSALDFLLTAGGNGELEEALTATQAIGSVTSGKTYPKGTSLETVLRDILIKEEAPTVALTLNPAKVLYDVVEETLSTIVLTATVTKKTYPPTKVTYYVDDVVVSERTITDGGTFSYTHNFASATNENHTFKVVVTDGKLSSNATKTIKFVGNSYYGTVASDIGTPTEAQIKGLNKTLKDVKGYTYDNITMDFGKVVYAFPKDFGALTSIKDTVNNLNYTDSFSRTVVNVDGIDYYVYTQTDPSAAEGIKLVFA
ncbi:MAG: hypothetical protein KBT35_07915 [Firmicutes bacterium]|nr:hypothetical protein [Candidatus Colivicinus equi]